MSDSPKQAAIARPPEQRYLWILLVFAAAIRLYDLGGKQLWVDEIMQAMASSPSLSLAGVLRAVTGHVGMAPLDYLVQHYVTAALGQTEFALRLPAAVFGTATIAAVYYLFRMLLDARLALLSAALYAVYPLHHHYSQEGRPYALFVLLTVLSYLTFCTVLARGTRADWILYIATNTLLLYSQYFGVFVFASQLLISLAMLSRRARHSLPLFRKVDLRFLVTQTAALAAAALLFLPWFFYAISRVTDFTPMPVHFGFKLALSFIQELGDGSHPLAWILIFLAVWGARSLARERKYEVLQLLLIWLLLPIPLIFLLLWIKDYFFAIRHFLFLTPALYVLVALGIAGLSEQLAARYSRQGVTRAAAALVAAISLLMIGLHMTDTREDFRGAAQYLSQNVAPGDIIIAPRVDGILSYYYPQIFDHAQPVNVLSDRSGVDFAGRKTFIVDTAYMPATDRQTVQSMLGNFPSRQSVNLRKVQITKAGSRQ